MVFLGALRALRVLRSESLPRGEAGLIRVRWLVGLAVLMLAFHFGSQAGRGYYARLQMPGVLDEAIAAARSALAGSGDPQAALQAKLVQAAAEVGVGLGPESLLIEPSGQEVLLRVQWAAPLVLHVEVYRLAFEIHKGLPATDQLGRWLKENVQVRRRPAPPRP
jgi:hypothetical protein